MPSVVDASANQEYNSNYDTNKYNTTDQNNYRNLKQNITVSCNYFKHIFASELQGSISIFMNIECDIPLDWEYQVLSPAVCNVMMRQLC